MKIKKFFGMLQCCIQPFKTECNYRYKITNKCVVVVVGFIAAFLDLPQQVSASYCHHQGAVVTSEATQAILLDLMYRYDAV
jgi:hypothetical protein